MPEVRISCSCGISAFFLQCCFMIERQVLMTVSYFSEFFPRNHFLEGGFTFPRGGIVFHMRKASFLSERCPMGALVLIGAPLPCPLTPLWKTLMHIYIYIYIYIYISLIFICQQYLKIHDSKLGNKSTFLTCAIKI